MKQCIWVCRYKGETLPSPELNWWGRLLGCTWYGCWGVMEAEVLREAEERCWGWGWGWGGVSCGVVEGKGRGCLMGCWGMNEVEGDLRDGLLGVECLEVGQGSWGSSLLGGIMGRRNSGSYSGSGPVSIIKSIRSCPEPLDRPLKSCVKSSV